MTTNNSQIAVAAPELLATMTGSVLLIGVLIATPAIIIFDNQGTVAVSIYVNNTSTAWRTFPAGEALVLDLRAAHANAPDFTFSTGTSFYGNGASGNFSISYIYPQNM
jgi:hypothetical protein